MTRLSDEERARLRRLQRVEDIDDRVIRRYGRDAPADEDWIRPPTQQAAIKDRAAGRDPADRNAGQRLRTAAANVETVRRLHGTGYWTEQADRGES